MKDPDHPIVEAPWTYEIADLRFHKSTGDPDESWLDLTLQKGDVVRRLRFLKPQSIQIEDGFPNCPGLCILDISSRQLDDITVEVGGFEAGGGALKFWAADVIDLDEQE